MKLALSLFVILASSTIANPVLPTAASKVWERCVVAVSKEQAQVSCAVGYVLESQGKSPLDISVPVYVPLTTPEKSFAGMIQAKLEPGSGGPVLQPTHYKDQGAEGAPAGTKRVDCVFLFPKELPKNFSLVISYQQPLHNGQFFYRPEFEDGEKERDADTHSITVFPLGDASVELVEPKSPRNKALTTRITVLPEHRKMITVSVR